MGIKIYLKLCGEFKKINNAKKRAKKNLTYKTDLERVYEGLFLYSVTLFENYLEELFYSLVLGNVKGRRGYSIKLRNEYKFIKNINKGNVEKVLLGEKGSYLDWLPYNTKTIPRSKKVIDSGSPFNDLTTLDKDDLSKVILIRNYIAHKSKSSKVKVINSTGKNFTNSYDLLTRIHSGNNTYFEYYLLLLNSISGKLQSKLQDN